MLAIHSVVTWCLQRIPDCDLLRIVALSLHDP